MTSDHAAVEAAKLLPCPFCGGAAFLHENDWCEPPQQIVMCRDPQCSSGAQWGTEFEAIAAWNRRAAPPSNWRPIETAPRRKDCEFWLELADDIAPHNPPMALDSRNHRFRGEYGTWSSAYKATHWQPLPAPPAREPEADGR